jgi:EAL domain-containing protein (putative c-di-GMP-specific phosphodiesterase class I)
VRALRDAGVRTAWDDFGDGDVRYASLREAAFDVVKVPVTFVLRNGRYDDAVVQAAVGFARAIGAVVVAEGVETVASRDRVRGLGCDVGQGYLWSRIVPGDRIPAALDAITIDGARTT